MISLSFARTAAAPLFSDLMSRIIMPSKAMMIRSAVKNVGQKRKPPPPPVRTGPSGLWPSPAHLTAAPQTVQVLISPLTGQFVAVIQAALPLTDPASARFSQQCALAAEKAPRSPLNQEKAASPSTAETAFQSRNKQISTRPAARTGTFLVCNNLNFAHSGKRQSYSLTPGNLPYVTLLFCCFNALCEKVRF